MLFTDQKTPLCCYHTCTECQVSFALISDFINIAAEAAGNFSCEALCICLLDRHTTPRKTHHLHALDYQRPAIVLQKWQTEDMVQRKII